MFGKWPAHVFLEAASVSELCVCVHLTICVVRTQSPSINEPLVPLFFLFIRNIYVLNSAILGPRDSTLAEKVDREYFCYACIIEIKTHFKKRCENYVY